MDLLLSTLKLAIDELLKRKDVKGARVWDEEVDGWQRIVIELPRR